MKNVKCFFNVKYLFSCSSQKEQLIEIELGGRDRSYFAEFL